MWLGIALQFVFIPNDNINNCIIDSLKKCKNIIKAHSLTFMGFTGFDHVHDCTDHPIKVKKWKKMWDEINANIFSSYFLQIY